MIQRCDLTLIADQERLAKLVFATEAEEEAFRRQFYESVKDDLAKWDRARARSIMESMSRGVN